KQAPPQESLKQGEQMWSAWKDNISVKRVAGQIDISAEIDPHALEAFKYTDWLFVDTYRALRLGADKAKKLGVRTGSDLRKEVLPRAIKEARGEYRVRPALEEVDGAPCHVVEKSGPTMDVIWVDAARGFVVRRRQRYQSPGSLFEEVHNAGFAERAP